MLCYSDSVLLRCVTVKLYCVTVKLWSTNLDNSVASIEAKANVCCVKFSPTSRYHLAFGCAGTCGILTTLYNDIPPSVRLCSYLWYINYTI